MNFWDQQETDNNVFALDKQNWKNVNKYKYEKYKNEQKISKSG